MVVGEEVDDRAGVLVVVGLALGRCGRPSRRRPPRDRCPAARGSPSAARGRTARRSAGRGPTANCAAAKIALTTDAFSTPTGVVARSREVRRVDETLPFGAAALTRSVHGITGAAPASRMRRASRRDATARTSRLGSMIRSRSAAIISDWPPPYESPVTPMRSGSAIALVDQLADQLLRVADLEADVGEVEVAAGARDRAREACLGRPARAPQAARGVGEHGVAAARPGERVAGVGLGRRIEVLVLRVAEAVDERDERQVLRPAGRKDDRGVERDAVPALGEAGALAQLFERDAFEAEGLGRGERPSPGTALPPRTRRASRRCGRASPCAVIIPRMGSGARRTPLPLRRYAARWGSSSSVTR